MSRFAVPEYPLAPTIDRSNDRSGHHFEIIARLKSGVTMTQAQAESESMARRLKRQYGHDEGAVGATVIGPREDLVGQTRPALFILLAAVILLLLVACVNVANLLLARGAARHKEIAIRSALEARRRRITCQLLTESVLLAAAGGVGGILFAYRGLIPLRAFLPAEMVSGAPLKIDLSVLAFAAALSLAAAIVFGFFPALGLANRDLNATLGESGRSSTTGAQTRRIASCARCRRDRSCERADRRRRAPDPKLRAPAAQCARLYPVRSLRAAFGWALLGLFAILALTLACIGIYGVMAYTVAQRTSEIGIRIALGARPAGILKLVMGAGLRLAPSGIASGAILSLGLNRFLANALYGVKPADGAIFTAAVVLLMLVAVLASHPARRAMSIDPVVALRAE